MQLRTLVLAGLALQLAACANLQTRKVASLADRTLCIVDNPMVRYDFRDAYARQLQAKGYATKVVATRNACPTSTTYPNASYGFHWGLYLATAELVVYNGEVEAGRSTYAVDRGSPDKHGQVEDKIAAMVAQLLP